MDAALIVSKHGIADKSVQVLASGNADAYEEVKPLLRSFGDTVVYTGELGTGTAIKLAYNLVRRGIGLAIGEGNRLRGQSRGGPPTSLGLHAPGTRGATSSVGKSVHGYNFPSKLRGTGRFQHCPVSKGRRACDGVGRRHDVPMPIAALVEQVMVQAVGRGWSEESTASLFRLQEEAAGIQARKRAI